MWSHSSLAPVSIECLPCAESYIMLGVVQSVKINKSLAFGETYVHIYTYMYALLIHKFISHITPEAPYGSISVVKHIMKWQYLLLIKKSQIYMIPYLLQPLFSDMVLLCSLGWTGACYIDLADLEFIEIHLPLPPEC